ncbi:MAG: SUMF1/EgtB/PvdO family nonheme iron enzyme, partial [Magnetococcales bacterium]|nr:SUMF1/EgtB/PvdO family nonheme iron enzyme [Magnetococcales bacterium]
MAGEEPAFDLSAAEAGRMLGRFTPGYRVVRRLGKGAYGAVFLAEDDWKQMAVKIIPLAFRPADAAPHAVIDDQENFTRDWEVIKTLWGWMHHSSLVRVRDYYLFDDPDPSARIARYGLITMDYWPWELHDCVRHLLEQKCHTPVRRRTLLFNLAQSLYRLHQDTGLLITDLKPDNIVLNQCHTGALLVGFIDMGSLFRQGAADYSRVDTADAYLAPELADKKTTLVDETALVYSFGLIGHLILEGRHPFQGMPEKAPYSAEFRRRNGIHFSAEARQSLPECVAILEHCLREDPRERLPTFAALVAALEQERNDARERMRIANMALVQATRPKPTPSPGTRWRDPVAGLELVWIPGGSFMMGQTEEESRLLRAAFTEKQYANWFTHELPNHQVELDGFWMAATPVTRGQWQRFVEECLHVTDAQRIGYSTGMGKDGWGRQKNYHWQQPGFAQDDAHPVVCVSWFDAQSFAAWLSRNSG